MKDDKVKARAKQIIEAADDEAVFEAAKMLKSGCQGNSIISFATETLRFLESNFINFDGNMTPSKCIQEEKEMDKIIRNKEDLKNKAREAQEKGDYQEVAKIKKELLQEEEAFKKAFRGYLLSKAADEVIRDLIDEAAKKRAGL